LERLVANRSQIGSNSTLPVTISSIRLIGGTHTRRSFLDRIFNPLLSANRDKPYTLGEALNEVSSAAEKLRRFGTCSLSQAHSTL
jgi:outer membrane protein insertion porin family